MKRILGLLALLAFSTLPAMAQLDATPKLEAGFGFMYRNFDTPFQARTNEIGWFGTVNYNFTDHIGLAADIDGGYAHPFHVDTRQYTYTFGPRIYPIGHRTLTPFAEALFGVSHFTFPDIAFSDSGFDWAVGGGVDWRIKQHIAIRLAQFDFEQTRNFSAGTEGNPNQNNFKFKSGVIFQF